MIERNLNELLERRERELEVLQEELLSIGVGRLGIDKTLI